MAIPTSGVRKLCESLQPAKPAGGAILWTDRGKTGGDEWNRTTDLSIMSAAL